MPASTDPAAPVPAPSVAASPFTEFRQHRGMYLCGEIEDLVRTLPAKSFLVENLIQPCSINLLVGDSGIGKTALGYQLGLAVAAGVPFLGFPVRQGKVLLVDYENAIWDFHRILEQQRKHLGLAAYPANFLLWPLHPSHRDGQLQEAILEMRPQLVIVDSLRSFAPALERTTSRAGAELRKLRQLIRTCGTALLLMHHVHKPRGRALLDLEEGELLDWMLQAAGSRAVINQTDTRLAIAARRSAAPHATNDDLLVLRGQARTRGEIGPFFLGRCWDENGEPLGYERALLDPSLLPNEDEQAAYLRLPDSFQFREAKWVYDKPASSTHRFLERLIGLGLAQKTARGGYRKRGAHTFAGNPR